jgi:hypothetical protein
MLCGAYYQSTHRILKQEPKARLAMSLPAELPVGIGEAPAVMKAAQNPNAAVLLAGWLASSEGQKGYDQIGRGSPFVEGTEKCNKRAPSLFLGDEARNMRRRSCKRLPRSGAFPRGKSSWRARIV